MIYEWKRFLLVEKFRRKFIYCLNLNICMMIKKYPILRGI